MAKRKSIVIEPNVCFRDAAEIMLAADSETEIIWNTKRCTPKNVNDEIVSDMCRYVSLMQEAGRSNEEQARELLRVYRDKVHSVEQEYKRGEAVQWEPVTWEVPNSTRARAAAM